MYSLKTKQKQINTDMMKKIFIAIFAVLAATAASFAQNQTKFFKVNEIHGIRATGIFHISYEEDDSETIEVTGPEETMKCVVVKNMDGVLSLLLDFRKVHGRGSGRSNISYNSRGNDNKIYASQGRITLEGPVYVKVKSRQLDVIILNGVAKLTTKGTFKGGKTTVKLSGAASVKNTSLSVEDVYADLTGASSVSLNGSFKGVKALLSGASTLKINGNMVDFDIECSGASKLEATTNANEGKLECSGAVKAVMDGSVQNIELECSGASNAALEDLTARNATIRLSGASNASISVLSSITAKLSGASSLRYKGNPAKTDFEKNTASSIKKR